MNQTATITIKNPDQTYAERISLAEWLKQQAEYVISDEHAKRSEMAEECVLVYPEHG